MRTRDLHRIPDTAADRLPFRQTYTLRNAAAGAMRAARAAGYRPACAPSANTIAHRSDHGQHGHDQDPALDLGVAGGGGCAEPDARDAAELREAQALLAIRILRGRSFEIIRVAGPALLRYRRSCNGVYCAAASGAARAVAGWRPRVVAGACRARLAIDA